MSDRRRWKWWHVALLVLGLTMAAGGLFVAAVVVSFIGGVDELFRGDPPREGDPEVVAARQAADRDLVELAKFAPEIAAASEKAVATGYRDLDFCRLDEAAFSSCCSCARYACRTKSRRRS